MKLWFGILMGLALACVVWAGILLRDVPAPSAPLTAQEGMTTTSPAVAKPPVPELTIDVVRIGPDGTGLIAGQVQQNETVQIFLDGAVLVTARPDNDGRFAAFVDLPASDKPRKIHIAQTDQQETGKTVLIAPIAPPLPKQVADIAKTQADAPPSPAVLIADETGVRVSATETDRVALDTISYDAAGTVAISGRSLPQSTVQLYLDNRPVRQVPVAQGQWRVDLPDVAQGTYTLRVDAVDASGAVQSRIETPFRRESAADVAAIMADKTTRAGGNVAVRTVQPGNTLWAIAQETYGDGYLYVRVFQANADLIRDPDLIYPGQVFRLPPKAEAR